MWNYYYYSSTWLRFRNNNKSPEEIERERKKPKSPPQAASKYTKQISHPWHSSSSIPLFYYWILLASDHHFYWVSSKFKLLFRSQRDMTTPNSRWWLYREINTRVTLLFVNLNLLENLNISLPRTAHGERYNHVNWCNERSDDTQSVIVMLHLNYTAETDANSEF